MACRMFVVLLALIPVLKTLVPDAHKLQSSNKYNFLNYYSLQGLNVTLSKSLVDPLHRLGSTWLAIRDVVWQKSLLHLALQIWIAVSLRQVFSYDIDVSTAIWLHLY